MSHVDGKLHGKTKSIKWFLIGIAVVLLVAVTGDGCTAFVTKNEYKSVPTVNLSFAGYSENPLPIVYFLIDF